MKTKFIKIIHKLLGITIVGMVIAYIIKPIWFVECVSTLSIIAFISFVLEVLVCHFGNACTSVISYCKSKLLMLSRVIADKLEPLVSTK